MRWKGSVGDKWYMLPGAGGGKWKFRIICGIRKAVGQIRSADSKRDVIFFGSPTNSCVEDRNEMLMAFP